MDIITLETIWKRLIAVVDEGAAALVRTSFSTVVRDSYDFSVIITDRRGNSLVQASDSLPSFIGTLPRTVRSFLQKFPEETLVEGDILITNDMFAGTGHLPDITVVRPLFYQGVLIGFAASTAHAPDIGGKIRSPEPREIFEEGLQIPLMKLAEAGVINQTLMAILRKNVRVPELVEGDLMAQLNTLALIDARINEVLGEYGLYNLEDFSMQVRARSEAAMRKAISELPDGTYRTELSTDGLTDQPIRLAVAVIVSGDCLHVDYTGSSPQVHKAINCAMNYTYSMTAYALKCILAPEIPNNDGFIAPIEVTAPEGSIVNPVFPASGGSRVLIGHFLPTLVFQALGEIVPEHIIAGSGSPIWCLNLASIDASGRPLTNLFFFNGGMGASAKRNGLDVMSWPGNISSTPSEVIEATAPLRVLEKSISRDSGGAGLFHGGRGQRIRFAYTGKSGAVVSFLSERTKIGAPGLSGGSAGAVGGLWINGKPIDPKAQHQVEPGDVIEMATPGGGGFGSANVGADEANTTKVRNTRH